ncbi:1-acyl-sn-glycerol-3-phosphate acyltransferase [Shewanella surugensis]|uniref:1-acyl-sn-glycerol-3-phosphate acyltransferase n=1 Tax=Shewanella surugensis TaxID=212020 RepID=A0ABT0LJ60_9GAMM|nr:1-acyl-sn-glycerol-3-phosphate acyltransferase [Shewanella surugensis]MCL1127739.1 1-acyl-sn-glycerol-3-phosphate acyltransferase [Shewanella surugensis]
MNTNKIRRVKNEIKSHQHYDIDLNVKFQSTMKKIRHSLSHYDVNKVSDLIPSGNIFVYFFIKLFFRFFELFSLKEINESTKSTYVLNQRQDATIFVSNHVSHSDPFVISELFSRHRTSSSYILFFTSSHLNVFPLNIFYKAGTSFIKRNDEMDEQDKLLLLDYISESKSHDLSFLLYPEGTLSVSGNAIKMKLGLLKYLLKADYENMVIVKMQYTRILDFDLHPIVREKSQWPKNQSLSLRLMVERLKYIINYSSAVYVDTKKISLQPFSENNIESLANEIGFQLNSLFLFGDIEKIETAIFTNKDEKVNIETLYHSIQNFLDSQSIEETKKIIIKICHTFNFKIINNEIILNKKGHDELFTAINQYIYAWLPYALKANNYELTPVEMECLFLNNIKYKEMMEMKLNDKYINNFKNFNIENHLNVIVKSFDIR